MTPREKTVAAVIELLAARLLGAHVAQRAQHESRLGLGQGLHVAELVAALVSFGLGWVEQLGQAEVEDLGVAVRGHHHVLRA
jgi:hypothetical protein